MAKKASKQGGGPGPGDAVGAVRTAVERTFQATAGGAQSTRGRAQELVDEVAGVAGRVRALVDELNVVEEIRSLRSEVDALSRRVAELERSGGSGRPARKPPGARKPAAKKKRASQSSRASRSSSNKSGASRKKAS